MKIVPLEEHHLDAAADLLARTQAAAASAAPTPTVADPAVARALLAAGLGTGPAVAAVDGTALVAFMVVPLPPRPGSHGARWNDTHHAADQDCARDAYRHIYAAVAPVLIAAGCFHHSIAVLASSAAAVNAFSQLGFGIDEVKGTRPLVADASPQPPSRIRAAEIDDIDAAAQLCIELTQFHSRSPILRPALLGDFQPRRELRRNIESEHNMVLVADDDHRLTAMIQAEADARYRDTVTIGMNIVTEAARSAGLGTAMLQAITPWALDNGFLHCTVSWSSANLTSDAFYRSRDFTPIRYRLGRHIDPRVTWANETLDYSQFQPA